MLFFGSQVIAVLLAVFLDHGNGRAIKSTSNDNIERIFDLAEEELKKIFNETNERTTEQEENPADVLGLSEPDSPSHEVVQSQFSSDKMIQPKAASPAVLRQKRSLVGPCYSDKVQTVKLASGGLATFPICKKVSLTGCTSSLSSSGKRLCEASLTTVLIRGDDGTDQLGVFAKSCSCAV